MPRRRRLREAVYLAGAYRLSPAAIATPSVTFDDYFR